MGWRFVTMGLSEGGSGFYIISIRHVSLPDFYDQSLPSIPFLGVVLDVNPEHRYFGDVYVPLAVLTC